MTIRVGRCKYDRTTGARQDCQLSLNDEIYTPILVLTKSSAYGTLSPFELKNEDGQIMENIWQFSKIYRQTPNSQQRYSRYDKKIIWEYPAAQFLDKHDIITPTYVDWRTKGYNNPYAVRYPVGYSIQKNSNAVDNKYKCVAAIYDDSVGWDKCKFDYSKPITQEMVMDYITARKKIYLPLYYKLVQDKPQFKELQNRHQKGENLMIIEVDGPHGESLDYYKKKYGVSNTFIEADTMIATKENINLMLNDELYPFGHGYCLAAAIQEYTY